MKISALLRQAQGTKHYHAYIGVPDWMSGGVHWFFQGEGDNSATLMKQFERKVLVPNSKSTLDVIETSEAPVKEFKGGLKELISHLKGKWSAGIGTAPKNW